MMMMMMMMICSVLLILCKLSQIIHAASDDDLLISVYDPATDTTHVFLEDIVREMDFAEGGNGGKDSSVVDGLLDKLRREDNIKKKMKKEKQKKSYEGDEMDESIQYKTYQFRSVEPLLRYLEPMERARILPLFLDPYIDTGRGREVDSKFPQKITTTTTATTKPDQAAQWVIDAFAKMSIQLVNDIRGGVLGYAEAVPVSLKRSLLREWYRRPHNRTLQNLFVLLVMALDVVERTHRYHQQQRNNRHTNDRSSMSKMVLEVGRGHSFGWVEGVREVGWLVSLFIGSPERTEWVRHFETQLRGSFEKAATAKAPIAGGEDRFLSLLAEYLHPREDQISNDDDSRCCPTDGHIERLLDLVRAIGPQQFALSWPFIRQAITQLVDVEGGKEARRRVLIELPVDLRVFLLNAIVRLGRPSHGDWEVFEDLRASLRVEPGEELDEGILWTPNEFALFPMENSNTNKNSQGGTTATEPSLCRVSSVHYPICQVKEMRLLMERVVHGRIKEPSTISSLVAIFESLEIYNLTEIFDIIIKSIEKEWEERAKEGKLSLKAKNADDKDERNNRTSDNVFEKLTAAFEITPKSDKDEAEATKPPPPPLPQRFYANLTSFLHTHTLVRGRVELPMHKRLLVEGGKQFRAEIMSQHLYLDLFDFRAIPFYLHSNRQEYIRGAVGSISEILWMGEPIPTSPHEEASINGGAGGEIQVKKPSDLLASPFLNLPPIPIRWGDFAQSAMALAYRNGASLKDPDAMAESFGPYIHGITALAATQGILSEAGLAFLTRNFCQGFLNTLLTYAFEPTVRWRSIHLKLLVSRISPAPKIAAANAGGAGKEANMLAIAALLDRLAERVVLLHKDRQQHIWKWFLRFGALSGWWEWQRYVRSLTGRTRLEMKQPRHQPNQQQQKRGGNRRSSSRTTGFQSDSDSDFDETPQPTMRPSQSSQQSNDQQTTTVYLSDRFLSRLIRSFPFNGGSEQIKDLMELASWLVAAAPPPGLDNLRALQAWIHGIQEREETRTPFRERLLALVQANTGRQISWAAQTGGDEPSSTIVGTNGKPQVSLYTSTGRACALKTGTNVGGAYCQLDHPTRFSIHLEMDQLDFNSDTRHASLDLILSVMAEEVANSMRQSNSQEKS